jgi:D-alanyl-D-alanine carboxypeptidase
VLPSARLACLAAAVVLGAVMAVAAAPARANGAPKLASPAAVVLDAATGDEIFARRADEVRPIASLTKIFVAMVLRRHRVDLERWTEIEFDDARGSAGGTHTLLLEGQTFQNRDLLYAMLLSSDNRVPSALARSVGLSGGELIAELGRAAGDLGLAHTPPGSTTRPGSTATPRPRESWRWRCARSCATACSPGS